MSEPTRSPAQQRELGGDPAADRAAHDGHAGQAELVEQVPVDLGELADRIEPGGARGAAESGVDGGQYPQRVPGGQQVGESGHRVRAGAAVQQQDRAALPAFGDRDRDGAGG